MIDPARLPERVRETMRLQLQSRMEGLRSDRLSWWMHWAQLAEVFLPRRYKWFITPNQFNRGSQINTSIIDETGVIAARSCAAGMMAGLTSPTRPWFRLGLAGLDNMDYGPVLIWLAECERRMMRVFSESNFYTSLGMLYLDMVVFGSASQIIYEDPDQVIRCYNPCLGEFFFASAGNLGVSTFYREFTYTRAQCVDMFGLDALPEATRVGYKQGGSQRSVEVVVCHAIEPNDRIWQDGEVPLQFAVPRTFKYREAYWLREGNTNHLVKLAGYKEKPFIGARWDITGNDAYGRSPGMDAMPATRQLQVEQRRKGEAIDKLVRPPMVASVNMRNEPASILPGAINYVSDIQGAGFKPAYQVEPRLQEMGEDIKEVQDRINKVFFIDLFMMITQLDTVRTATEIDARREEKLVQLGPVIERFENEVLDPIIDRVFGIMARRGLFPPAPPEIQGREVNVQYISMLAEAQRAASTSAIERLLQVVGNMAGIDPSVLDNVDLDATVEQYAQDLTVPPKLIRPMKAVMALRAAKAQERAAQTQAQLTMAGTEAAKNLSATDVGGGKNALEMMMGGA